MNFSSFQKPSKLLTAGWRVIGDKKIYARSRWEANYGKYLQFLKDHGKIADWAHEPKTFWFKGIKRGTCSYLPDFCVTENTGRTQWFEVKGHYSAKDFTKIKRFGKYYPDEKLTVIDGKWFKKNNSTMKNIVPGWEK